MRLLALAAVAVISVAPSLARAERVVIKAGRLVDPESGSVSANRTVVIENGRIVETGGAGAAGGARVIDLSDSTVLPGLFDCHSHLCANIPARARVLDEM